jgi:tol-pal system protein YbgF
MMKYSVWIFLGVMATGCVPTADFTALRDDVREVQADNKKLKQAEAELRKRVEVTDKNSLPVATVKRLDTLDAALADLKTRQQTLDQRLAVLTTQVEDTLRQLDSLSVRLEEPPPKPQPKAASPKPSQPGPGGFENQAMLSPTASFNLAYNDYLKGNYDLAVAGFENFLHQYPSTSLAAHAQYWIGESYANKHEYRPAVDAYERLISTYPKSDKLPAALYKAALGYTELGDLAKGRSLFKRLIEEHPQSDEAARAKQKLAELR